MRSFLSIADISYKVQCMMAATTVDYGKIEAWVVMEFLFLQGKGAAEIHGKMKDDCPLYSTVKSWVARFWTSHLEVTDEPWSGRPISTTTEDKANSVNAMILENHQISAKVIAET
ncbi:hypothetical protein SK128_002470 [Halocaridina rubra]|uniref:Mos1 transposase HTH domain-containing protein n=1 Tax=Halocaridina rubra TaxID=373956 RepID=A0AAN8XVF1_HALRR